MRYVNADLLTEEQRRLHDKAATKQVIAGSRQRVVDPVGRLRTDAVADDRRIAIEQVRNRGNNLPIRRRVSSSDAVVRPRTRLDRTIDVGRARIKDRIFLLVANPVDRPEERPVTPVNLCTRLESPVREGPFVDELVELTQKLLFLILDVGRRTINRQIEGRELLSVQDIDIHT